MAGNPTDIGHASKFVSRVDIEDKLERQCGTKQVTTSGVDEALGLASRTRSLRKAMNNGSESGRDRLT